MNNLTYFFFDAKNKGSNDFCSLYKFYQTILHQLLEGIRKTRPKLKAECFKLVRNIILKEGLRESAYIEALREVFHLAQLRFLVIDALDECRDAETEELKGWLEKITAFPNLQIVITSRSLQKTKKLYDNPRYINLQLSGVVDRLDEDIEKFIIGRVDSEEWTFPDEMLRVVSRLKARSSVRLPPLLTRVSLRAQRLF